MSNISHATPTTKWLTVSEVRVVPPPIRTNPFALRPKWAVTMIYVIHHNASEGITVSDPCIWNPWRVPRTLYSKYFISVNAKEGKNAKQVRIKTADWRKNRPNLQGRPCRWELSDMMMLFIKSYLCKTEEVMDNRSIAKVLLCFRG